MVKRALADVLAPRTVAGVAWYSTAPGYAHAVLPAGLVDVRQHLDNYDNEGALMWRVRCYDVADELAYLGGPDFHTEKEAMAAAVKKSAELAKRRKK